ncbi:MAG: hypothetical protein F4Z84_07495 [Gammaproteobacteria bacterium]|nr:hypothetical protein [Gammaproteobacteria bacterium]
MNEEFLNRLLRPVHPSWRNLLCEQLQNLDEAFAEELEADPHWFPGADRCLAAFSVSRFDVRVVWLGESPYPRQESATGLSFQDGAVDEMFRSDGRLAVRINRATSLRNVLKACFVATDRLAVGQTSSDHVRLMDHNGLVTRLGEIFDRGQQSGWLWLNAGLSLRPELPRTAQIRNWEPLVNAVLQDVSARGARVALMGKFAERFEPVCHNPLVSVHPRREEFMVNQDVTGLLRHWRNLIED